MTSNTCIFCSIIQRLLPASIIAENEAVIVIKDIAPKAPIHYLIIPKKHTSDIVSLVREDLASTTPLFAMAEHLAGNLSGSQAFCLIINNGADAGQKVFHMHMHFIAGKQMHDF